MAESVPQGPLVPPPGQRSGSGSESLLPYLTPPRAPLNGDAPAADQPDGNPSDPGHGVDPADTGDAAATLPLVIGE